MSRRNPEQHPAAIRPGIWLFAAACLLAALGIAAGLTQSGEDGRRAAVAAKSRESSALAIAAEPQREAIASRSDAAPPAHVGSACSCAGRVARGAAAGSARGIAARRRDGARRCAWRLADRRRDPRARKRSSARRRVARSRRRRARGRTVAIAPPRTRACSASPTRYSSSTSCRTPIAERSSRSGYPAEERTRAAAESQVRGLTPEMRRDLLDVVLRSDGLAERVAPEFAPPESGLRVGGRVALKVAGFRSPGGIGRVRSRVRNALRLTIVWRSREASHRETSHPSHRTQLCRRYVSRRQKWEKCMEGQAHQSAIVFALSHMTIEGMVTMTILGLMSFASWTVIVGKAAAVCGSSAASPPTSIAPSRRPTTLSSWQGQETEEREVEVQGRAALHGLRLRLPGDAGPADALRAEEPHERLESARAAQGALRRARGDGTRDGRRAGAPQRRHGDPRAGDLGRSLRRSHRHRVRRDGSVLRRRAGGPGEPLGDGARAWPARSSTPCSV